MVNKYNPVCVDSYMTKRKVLYLSGYLFDFNTII